MVCTRNRVHEDLNRGIFIAGPLYVLCLCDILQRFKAVDGEGKEAAGTIA